MKKARLCRCFAGAMAVPAGLDAAMPLAFSFSAAAVPIGLCVLSCCCEEDCPCVSCTASEGEVFFGLGDCGSSAAGCCSDAVVLVPLPWDAGCGVCSGVALPAGCVCWF